MLSALQITQDVYKMYNYVIMKEVKNVLPSGKKIYFWKIVDSNNADYNWSFDKLIDAMRQAHNLYVIHKQRAYNYATQLTLF